MSRNVVSVVVAFAMLVGGAMISTDSAAVAGHCGGGLFAKLKASRASCCAPVEECCAPVVEKGCGGGLFAKLKARRAAASCCAPEPVCCAPEPVCCAPEPVCCAPEPVCAPEPTCCAPAPACCGAAPVAAPCCGGEVHGETIISEAPVAADAPVESASDEVPPSPTAN